MLLVSPGVSVSMMVKCTMTLAPTMLVTKMRSSATLYWLATAVTKSATYCSYEADPGGPTLVISPLTASAK